MRGTAVPRWRTLPFNEHRHFGEVIETEDLLKRQRRGENMSAYGARLIGLQSRAVEPIYDDKPEPAA